MDEDGVWFDTDDFNSFRQDTEVEEPFEMAEGTKVNNVYKACSRKAFIVAKPHIEPLP